MRADRRRVASLALSVAAILVLTGSGCGSSKRTVTPGIRARAHTLEEASHEMSLAGDLERAAILEQRAVDAYRTIDDVEAVAGGLNRLGNLRQRAGNPAAAREAYREASDLARQSGALGEEAAAENNLGTLAEESGDVPAARGHYERALALAREGEAPRVEAAALNNLGLLALVAGDLEGARRRFEQALDIDRDQQDRAGEATRLRNLGSLHARAGDGAAAVEAFERAHEIDRAREDVPAIALDLVSSSEARAASGGDLGRAISERRRAREIHRFLKDDRAVERDGRQIEAWCVRLGPEQPPECALEER